MVGYLTLSTLPRKEKEKTMLLLAAADDKAWCVIHDAQHRFCIEWQVSSTHPALSFLPLKSVPSVHTGPGPSRREENTAPICPCGGPSPMRRLAPRTRGASLPQRGSPWRNGGTASDCSPLTIDLNNESSVAMDPLIAVGTSHPFARSYSPSKQRPQRQRSATTSRNSSTAAGGRRGGSQCSAEGSPFLNARSVFLRRQSTPRRASLSRVASWERGASRRSGSSVALTPTSGLSGPSSRSTTTRSAQWVSRLVEDIMSHVAKMAAIDHHQVRSVAALTVTVLSARYGALQWNRALKELAQGLHRYHSVSPLCRVFRELFIDEASSALEDLFLFCRLQRAAVKHSTVETQKVILPPMETESGAPQSIFQHTIVSRRYLRLRSLTAALSDMLTAVSVPEHREVGVIRVVRKRRLKPAEVVGVKTIVAYWIEEESSKSDSLAFDLGGFVDMHEVLAVVVKALSSAHQQIPVASRGACDPVNRDDVDEESLQKEEKATAVSKARKNNDENEEPLSYAARAHLIMQSRPQQPEGVVRPAQASYRPPPAVVNSVPLSAMSPIRSALQEGIVGTGRVPPTTLHGTSGERHEMFRGVPKSLARVSLQEERPQGYLRKPQNEVKKVAGCTSLHKGGDDAAAHQQGTVSRTEAPTSPGQISAEPVIVNLNHGPGAEIDEAPPQRNATESVNSGCLDSHKYGGGRQAQQYLAALAAIDAELQRRREVLKSTVAFDLSTCDPSRDVPVGPESSARPTERTVLWRDDCDATSATPSVEPTPQRAIGSGELTLSVTAADLEQPIESCEPPANASTFGHTTPPPLPPQHQPNSILLPSKHQSRTKPVEKSGDESSATQSDFEMLTAEERYLLADLRQALSRQK